MSRRSFATVDELMSAAQINDHQLGAHDDLSEEQLWEFVAARVGPVGGGVPVRLAGPLHARAQEQGKRRRLGLTVLQHMPIERLTAGGMLIERRQAAQGLERRIAQVSKVAVPSPPQGGRWPHRSAAARGEGKSLADAEAAARARLIDKMGDELIALKAPVVETLGATSTNRGGLQLLAAGRRAATLRRRLGDWRRMVSWTAGPGRVPVYPQLLEVLGYLQARVAEPCGRTVPRSAVDALRFLEEVGHRPVAERVADHALLGAAIQEMTAQLESRGPARRQAQYLPVQLVRAWEAVVMDGRRPGYVRYYAWIRLVKYWAALRFDDLRWADPRRVIQENQGLGLYLERTKVSGPGKRVGVLYAFISRDAHYGQEGWLSEGMKIRTAIMPENPFMFPVPTRDLEGAREVAGDYSDAAAASQALFKDLTVADEGGAERPLLPPLAGLFWTEHSERNALPTAAAALGMGDEIIRRLGRWQAGRITDVYVRSTTRIVAKAQREIAARVRARGSDFIGEGVALEKFAQFLRQKGHPEEVVDQAVKDLTYFGEDSGTEEEVLAPEESGQPEVEVAPRVEEQLDTDEASETEGLTGYVVSIVGRRRYRRLHHLGRCPMLPGTDYLQYEVYGAEAPPADAYDAVCARCWPPAAQRAEERRASSASSSGESSD